MLFRSPLHSDVCLLGADDDMLLLTVQKYSLSLSFTVKALVNQNNQWEWKMLNQHTVLDSMLTGKPTFTVRPEGETVSKIQLESPQKKKQQLKIRILLVVLLFALATGTSLLLQKLTDMTALPPEEPPSVAETISEQEALEHAEWILEAYNEEEISYKEAAEALDTVELQENEEFQKISEEIETLKKSKESYLAGQSAYQAGYYKEAAKSFQNVSELDKINFNSAQSYAELCMEKYKTSEKMLADSAWKEDNFKDAYQILQELSEEFPEDNFLMQECLDMQKKYLNEYVEQQKNAGNYFSENGAVPVVYELNAEKDIEGGIDALTEQGYEYERSQLVNLLNEKRESLGLSPVSYHSVLGAIAQGDAEKLAKEPQAEIYSDYNLSVFYAHSVQEAMENFYIEIEGDGELMGSSASIGIGISYIKEDKNCVWLVLSAKETNFLE